MQNQFPFQIELIKVFHKPKHLEDKITLFLVLSGQLQVEVNQNVYLLQSDDMMVINPSDLYCLNGKENIVLRIRISEHWIQHYLGQKRSFRLFCNSKRMAAEETETYNGLREELTHLMITCFKKNEYYEVEINKYFFSFFSYLIRHFRIESGSDDQSVNDIQTRARLVRVAQAIQQRFQEPLSLEQLAQEEYISYYHLSRAFKQNFGITFTNYLKQIRIQHALESLKYTDDPVTKVALNSGFPNVKSFHKVFKEVLEMTPGEYRKKQQGRIKRIEEKAAFEILNEETALKELSFYLVERDISHQAVVVREELMLAVQTSNRPLASSVKRIINIGDADYGLESEVQQELLFLKAELDYQVISFTGFCRIDDSSSEVFRKREYIFIKQWFDFIQKLGVVPLIGLDCPVSVKTAASIRCWCDEQVEMICYLVNRYGRDQVKKWYVEWQDSDPSKVDYFVYFYKAVKHLLPELKVGLLTLTGASYREVEQSRNFLQRLDSAQSLPDFYTFHAVPRWQMEGAQNRNYKQFRHYSCDIKDALITLFKELEQKGIAAEQLSQREIFLTDWNTLFGDNGVLAGTFFRAALIVEEMIHLSNHLSGIGYWLNMNSKDRGSQKRSDGDLSLFFIYRQVKRPVFYCLSFLDRMGNLLLDSGKGYLFTKRGDQLQLLLYNSNYWDPAYSLDGYWLKFQTKKVEVTIMELPQQSYMIRYYGLDKDHGGIYNEWVKIDGEGDIDKEIGEYLQKCVLPEFTVSKRETIHGKLSISVELSLNACKLFIFEPLC